MASLLKGWQQKLRGKLQVRKLSKSCLTETRTLPDYSASARAKIIGLVMFFLVFSVCFAASSCQLQRWYSLLRICGL